MAAVIGSLRAELSASIAQFSQDMGKAASQVANFATRFERAAGRMQRVGMGMTLAITAPIVAFGAATVQAAATFESSMNRVQAATGATADQFDRLEQKARDVGATTMFSATQAADAMETLAKNGLNAEQILGGALDATIALAAATGSELAPAADVATDVMLQFGVEARNLGAVVDGITGVLLASKFGFDDYRLALGQAGGVAGGLGVTLEDFNTTIAATSSLFASGSDAGTSFKTFLTRLNGPTTESRRAIEALGLRFFDAQGNMRSMGEIAGELERALGNLTDAAKAEALQTIFGTDAMRTAIGLMNTGAEGFAELEATIARASAQEQMAARMRGLSGAWREFRSALEAVQLAIAESGLLDFLANVVRGMTQVARWFAALPGPVLATATAIAAVVAAIGPLVALGGGLIALLGTLIPMFTGGGVFAGFAAAISGAVAAIAGPLAIAAAAIGAIIALVWQFRDVIADALSDVATTFNRVIGGDVRRLMESLGRLFETVSTGPLRDFFDLIGWGLAHILGLFTRVLGGTVTAILSAFVRTLTTAFDVIGGVLETISAVLRGDFSGAWEAAKGTVIDAVTGILSVLDAVFPGIAGAVTAIYEVVRRWIGEGISSLLNWIAERWAELPAGVRDAVNAAIGWARAFYTGVRTWLADNLGPLLQWAKDRIRDISNLLARIRGEAARSAPAGAPPPPAARGGTAGGGGVPTTRPPGGTAGLPEAFGGGGAAGRADQEARRIEGATRRLAEGLRDLRDAVSHGLDGQALPRSMAKAEQLRRRIEDLGQDARDAGVNMDAFAGEIAGLESEIERLEVEGLARDARDFGRDVEAVTRDVREFGSGALPPLEARLLEVDDAFEGLRSRIEAMIEENRALAGANAEAASAMASLEQQLAALDQAHAKATEAARAQYAAESALADLHARREMMRTQEEIDSLREDATGEGPLSSELERVAEIERDLARARIDALIELRALEAEHAEAVRTGDVEAAARLQGQIALQTELYDLVSETTAAQIAGATRVRDAFREFTDSLADQLSDMVLEWKGDLDGLRDVFKQLARQLFIRPFMDSVASGFSGFLKGFAGGFASGGFMPPNSWGVVGENGPELFSAGATGATIIPNEESFGGGRGTVVNQYISTPDADSFRKSRRQVAGDMKRAVNFS